MADTSPVEDWATDYNIFDPEYVQDPTPMWEELRGRCPIAHSERWGGSFLPTKYDDIQELAKMVPALSSRDPLVVRRPEVAGHDQPEGYGPETAAPPISSDPPHHTWTRRLLLPHFSPKVIEAHRSWTEALCNRLIDGFIDNGGCDAAGDYAQQIPPAVIAHKLGIDENRIDEFTMWVRNVLEFGLTEPQLRVQYRQVIRDFFREQVADRAENPRDDLISALTHSVDPDGNQIEPEVVVGMCNLQLVAGIDTTWSSIGSALWHLGTHESDRHRLAADDALFPTFIEESLRYYSPVTMAREVIEPVSYKDVEMQPGDKVLMNFPGANHDPDVFENPEVFQIDRQRNRHIAFGSGIHRCAGSNLARLEMDVALRTWVSRIPEFVVSAPDEVTWAGGQVRGPRYLPVSF